MLWIFGLVGLVLVVVIGLLVLGRETARLAAAPRPAVYDMAQAVDYIADRLPAEVQARISHADVRWVLIADADLLEGDTDDDDGVGDEGGAVDGADGDDEDADGDEPAPPVVDEDAAVARILALADASGRELSDEDVAAVLHVRLDYLRAIGAIGPRVDD